MRPRLPKPIPDNKHQKTFVILIPPTLLWFSLVIWIVPNDCGMDLCSIAYLMHASRVIKSWGESRPCCNVELCYSSQKLKARVWIQCTLYIVNENLNHKVSFVHKLELDAFSEFLMLLFEGMKFLLFSDPLVH